jgi:hypothetical protein
MIEPIPFAGMVEIDESFDRTASHMAGEYVAYKELTDEEIFSLTGFKDNPYDIFIEYEKEDLIEFARAILRKAQEK